MRSPERCTGCCVCADSRRTIRTSSARRSRLRMRSPRFSVSVSIIWNCFGFKDIKPYLSTRPAKAVGRAGAVEKAITSLRKAVDKLGLECEVDEGGGAFYGPKIDLKVKDANRARMADRDDPVRLQSAGTLRHDLHRRGREEASSVHGAPGADGFARTFLRHSDRAVCGGVSAVACAGTGAGAAGFGEAARLREEARTRAAAERIPGRNRRARVEPRGRRSRMRATSAFRICSWSANARPRTARRRCGIAGKGNSGRFPSNNLRKKCVTRLKIRSFEVLYSDTTIRAGGGPVRRHSKEPTSGRRVSLLLSC